MSVFDGARARTLVCHSEAIPTHLGDPLLHPVRLQGTEDLNSLFEYQLYLKTPDGLNPGVALDAAANLDLDAFIGREITCSIELDGAGEFLPGAVGASVDRIGAGVREISGLITDAQLWGEEGRRVQYKLTIRPWLHLATLSTDCKIFQNQSVVETLDELLADYPFPVEKRLIETYPKRDYGTQYNIFGKDEINLTSDKINLVAKTKLSLNGGTSYEEYESGKITKGTTGTYTNKARIHRLIPGDSKPTKPLNGEACGTKEKSADNGGNSVSRS